MFWKCELHVVLQWILTIPHNYSEGLLSGVLAMSGSAFSTFAIDHDPLATGRELAQKNGCPTTPVLEMVKCLQEVPVSAIIQADNGLQVITVRSPFSVWNIWLLYVKEESSVVITECRWLHRQWLLTMRPRWELWWTSVIGAGFSLSVSGFPLLIIIPYATITAAWWWCVH